MRVYLLKVEQPSQTTLPADMGAFHIQTIPGVCGVTGGLFWCQVLCWTLGPNHCSPPSVKQCHLHSTDEGTWGQRLKVVKDLGQTFDKFKSLNSDLSGFKVCLFNFLVTGGMKFLKGNCKFNDVRCSQVTIPKRCFDQIPQRYWEQTWVCSFLDTHTFCFYHEGESYI